MTPSGRQRTFFYLFNILLPLVIGGGVYLAFRDESYISLAFKKPGLTFRIRSFSPVWLYMFIRNHLSDILWAYSLTFAVSSVIGSAGNGIIITGVICIFYIILIEAFQIGGIFSGTPDILDVLFESAAVLISAGIIIHHEENYFYEI